MGLGRILWGLRSLGVFFWIVTGAYAHAATFTVNSTADDLDAIAGDGICATSGGACTLRAAIMEANHTPGGGATIILPAGVYILTIPTSGTDNETIGDLDIIASMSIVGAGSSVTIIDGNGGVTNDGVVEISASAVTVNISGVTVRNGGNSNVDKFGAGIFNHRSVLTLTSSIVRNNTTDNAGGGGIYNLDGIVNLINSTVSNNTASSGGGIVVKVSTGFAALNLVDSTVSGNNSFNGAGGGIRNDAGSLTVINSTISGNNSADRGGGIFMSEGTLTMINSTISGNSAVFFGGGVYMELVAFVEIFNSTITRNTAGTKETVGGAGGVAAGSGATLTFQNTILAGNRAFRQTFPKIENLTLQADDCSGFIDSGGHNLMSVQNCTVTGTAPVVADPKLGLLKFNGGPTKTHALLNGSPAIDTGDCDLGPKPHTDQRGFPRLVDGDHNGSFNCDIGAYEFAAGSPAPVDLGGDGETDVVVYQTSAGNWFAVESSTGFFRPAVNFGGPDFLPVPGDYDVDGKTDAAVYQQSTGNWFGVGTTAGFFTLALNFGGSGFIPVPGDYDGDGKTDAAVYQSSTAHWFIKGSTSGFFQVLSFGGAGFIPVPGDYDGDGKTDAAVHQASTGNWFVVGSTQGFFTPALNFGGAGFIPIPGDYDGDGRMDVAVYQSGTGHWFFLGSTSGFGQHLNFGGAGFTPVAGDYDGDGQTDTAVYQQSTGNWFIDQSTLGFVVQPSFGGAGFVPVLPQVTILRAMGLL